MTTAYKPNRIKTKKFLKTNKMIKKMVQVRLERSLKRKMEEELRVLKASQKDLRNFVLKRDYDNNKEEEEIIPYFYQGGTGGNFWLYRLAMWRGLKKSWKGFKVGKRLGEEGGDLIEQRLQKEYAVRVQDIKHGLELTDDLNDFSRIGVFWDSKKKRSVIRKDTNQYIEEDDEFGQHYG